MNKPKNHAWKARKNPLIQGVLLFAFIICHQSLSFAQSRSARSENAKEVQPKRDLPPSNELLNTTIKRIEIKQAEVATIQDVTFLDRYMEKLSSICPNIPTGKPFDLTHDQLIMWLQSYYGEGSEYMNLLLRIEEDWKSNQSSEN